MCALWQTGQGRSLFRESVLIMLKFTLLKQLYYAFDPRHIPEVREKRARDIFHRTLDVTHLGLSGIAEVTVQERYLPYSQRYCIYINDEKEEADIGEVRVKAFVLSFFGHYHPDYLKSPDLLELDHERLKDLDLLTCFEVDRMPGYQEGKYAYKDLITLEAIRNGEPDPGRQKHGFPGLIFAKKYEDRS